VSTVAVHWLSGAQGAAVACAAGGAVVAARDVLGAAAQVRGVGGAGGGPLLQRVAAAMEAAQDLDELRPLVRRLVRKGGATEVVKSKRRARLVAVRLAAGQGGDVNSIWESSNSWTPMARAAVRGEVSVVRALAEAGADLNQARTTDGATVVFLAAQGGHVKVVRALTEAGADLNQALTTDGATPFFVATQRGHLEVVRALTEAGADLNQAPLDGTTPI